MHIEIELNKNTAEKLKHIQQRTGEDIAQIISHALDLYYQQLQSQSQLELAETQPPKKSAFEVFQELGLIGYIKDGDPNLSTNYKALVHKEIEERHERERQFDD